MSEQVGSWILEARLGGGGMGQVWRARHARSGDPAAVKILSELDAREAASIGNEARAVAALSHPGIVRMLDYGRTEAGDPFLVTELAAGSIDQCPPTDFDDVVGLLRSVVEALAHAHARGVIHRDVKPANVLYFDDGSYKLTDLGIAVDVQGMDRPVLVAGTPHFMPEEQQQGRWRDLGPWTDLFAVGRLAQWALRKSGSAAPRGFLTWVETLCAPAISQRFRWAADALHALDGALATGEWVLPELRAVELSDTFVFDFGSRAHRRRAPPRPHPAQLRLPGEDPGDPDVYRAAAGCCLRCSPLRAATAPDGRTGQGA